MKISLNLFFKEMWFSISKGLKHFNTVVPATVYYTRVFREFWLIWCWLFFRIQGFFYLRSVYQIRQFLCTCILVYLYTCINVYMYTCILMYFCTHILINRASLKTSRLQGRPFPMQLNQEAKSTHSEKSL